MSDNAEKCSAVIGGHSKVPGADTYIMLSYCRMVGAVFAVSKGSLLSFINSR